MIETIAYCREKQSTVESGHETEPESTDNDEGNQASEDDRSGVFSNDDSIETEEQSSNEDDFEAHRESGTMSDDGTRENERKTIREKTRI